MPSATEQAQHPYLAQSSTGDGSYISSSTIFKLLSYTFLMITLPISSYFISKKVVLEDILRFSKDDSVIPSVLVTIIVIHILLGVFLYAAYTEEVPSKRKQA